MSQKKQTSKDLQKVNAPQTINANEPAIVEAQDYSQNTNEQPETVQAEFTHYDLFPTLEDGMKLEINGYKVTITKKEYGTFGGNFPFTAWDAVVVAPDGTEKNFAKVRNTAIRNYCHATSGITHNGTGERAITKILTDEEIVTECTARTAKISGMLQRADELFKKYTGFDFLAEIVLNKEEAPAADGQEAQTEPAPVEGQPETSPAPEAAPVTESETAPEQPTEEEKKPRTLAELFTALHRDAILAQLKKENNDRKEAAQKAKANNATRQAKKETRDLTAEISKLIAAGDFQKAAELMQQKANATKATEDTESPENGDESTK